MTKNQKLATAVREHVVIALGLLLYALAWNFFLFPHQVAGGGATGIAALVMYPDCIAVWLDHHATSYC